MADTKKAPAKEDSSGHDAIPGSPARDESICLRCGKAVVKKTARGKETWEHK